MTQANLEDVLLRHGFSVFDAAALSPRQQEELERLRIGSGLADQAWTAILQQFRPEGELERQRLEPLRAAWLEEAGLLAWLDRQVERDPLLRPRQPTGSGIHAPIRPAQRSSRASCVARRWSTAGCCNR